MLPEHYENLVFWQNHCVNLCVEWIKGMCSISRILSAAIVVTLMASISACADSNTFQIAVIGPMAVYQRAHCLGDTEKRPRFHKVFEWFSSSNESWRSLR